MKMTNEEKANEISERRKDKHCVGYHCYRSAIEMAKWKDEQEIQFLQSLLFQSATQNIFEMINNRIKLLKGE